MTVETHFANKTSRFGATTGASIDENEHNQALIAKLADFGIEISPSEVADVLSMGADTFVLRRGVTLSDKQLGQLYLILSCLRS